jgi:hypothetical protein
MDKSKVRLAARAPMLRSPLKTYVASTSIWRLNLQIFQKKAQEKKMTEIAADVHRRKSLYEQKQIYSQ